MLETTFADEESQEIYQSQMSQQYYINNFSAESAYPI